MVLKSDLCPLKDLFSANDTLMIPKKHSIAQNAVTVQAIKGRYGLTKSTFYGSLVFFIYISSYWHPRHNHEPQRLLPNCKRNTIDSWVPGMSWNVMRQTQIDAGAYKIYVNAFLTHSSI